MKQLIQKFNKTNEEENKLFTEVDETEGEDSNTIVW
jgi:hypothetical protein